MSKNPKNWGKLMKIANIDREFLHIFWTTWGNSMKFLGKMSFKIILKVTKNQCSTLSSSIEDTFFKKTQRMGGGVKLTPPPSPGRLGLKLESQNFRFKSHLVLSSTFYNCHLAVLQPTLGHSQSDSLTNPMFIKVFSTILTWSSSGAI